MNVTIRYFSVFLFILSVSSIVTLLLLFHNIETENTLVDDASLVGFKKNLNSLKSNVITYESVSIQRSPVVGRALSENIQCNLPENKIIKCLEKNGKLFVPFDFVAKKFDVTLHQKNHSNGVHDIFYSYSEAHSPVNDYNSSNEYLWFDQIGVDERERVKYISFIHGVPVSSQWKPSGHIYPIQVGQFGLSYFSKWIRNKTNGVDSSNENKFLIFDKNKFIQTERSNLESTANGFEFKFPEKTIYKTVYARDKRYWIADVSTNSNFEIIIDIMLRDQALASNDFIVRLIYRIKSNPIAKEARETVTTLTNEDGMSQVVYSIHIGKANLRVVRNLCVDACKGLKLKCNKCLRSINELKEYKSNKIVGVFYKVYQISLKGEGRIENSYFTDQAHAPNLEMANRTVEYLLATQNKSTNGWPIFVARKFDQISQTYLRTPWYSAMGQGHAISLLTRFYAHFQKEKYINAAAKALDLFDVDSSEGGVKAYFMNDSKFAWYEEYPTQPYSLFVLNGFLYSMFGVYDFISVCDKYSLMTRNSMIQIYFEKAKIIFQNGLRSLQRMLSLYDTGTRTFYDLRHVSNPKVNPNVARWDYHMLHVSQISFLINILEQGGYSRIFKNHSDIDLELLKNVRSRWYKYSIGIWNQNSQIKT